MNLRWSWHAETRDLFETLDPDALAELRRRPGQGARRGLGRAAGRAGQGPQVRPPAAGRRRRPGGVPRRRRAGTSRLGRRGAGGHRLLLRRVRHHRGAAAVLRRPGHPRRRPPQGGLRPRRPADRRRPALPGRLLRPGPVGRRLAARALPVARPARPAAEAAAPGRRLRRRHHRAAARGPHAARPRVAGPGRAACPCCCSTATSRRTRRPSAVVTDRLYGGDEDHRLRQEMLLGIGGVRAVRAYCALTGTPAPEVFHANEGHAGFQGVERIRELTEAHALSFAEALQAVRAGTVFTTHTPVPGRHRPVPEGAHRARTSPASACRCRSCSRSAPRRTRRKFNMAHMGLRLGQRANGVSQLHGARQPRHVQRPVAGLRRGRRADRLDHQRRARPDLDRPRAGRDGHADLEPGRPGRASTARCTSTASTRSRRPTSGASAARCAARLVEEVRRRIRDTALSRGATEAEVGWTDDRVRPRRPHHRLRPARAVLQAADPDAARPGAAQGAAARPRAADPARSSPARATRPTTAASS